MTLVQYKQKLEQRDRLRSKGRIPPRGSKRRAEYDAIGDELYAVAIAAAKSTKGE